MSRNYTLVTIKTLFGEASACAYPDCAELLIFADRGQKTAIAEIAHIRSAAPGGPRYDANYTGNVDGPDNLLLLCGKHHKPVDRHESTYSVAELEAWKLAQQAKAGSGTPISEADLRSYVVLTNDARKALTDIARLAQRVVGRWDALAYDLGALRKAHEKHRLREYSKSFLVGAYSEEAGVRTYLPSDDFSLSPMEQKKQREELAVAWQPHQEGLRAAIALLKEEVAVLRMTFGGGAITTLGNQIVVAAGATPLENTKWHEIRKLDGLVNQLWRVANGEVDPA